MCFAEKCCFCVKIKVGTVAFGVGSLAASAALVIMSSILLWLEDGHGEVVIGTAKLKMSSLNAMLVGILIVSVLGTFFSVLLLVGILKQMPGLVLSYFSFGILNSILMMLGCLLLLIHNYWYISLVWSCATLFYVHCVVLVHTVYELILRGKLNCNPGDDMVEELLNSDITE